MEKLPGEFGSLDTTHGERGDIWLATWRLIKTHSLGGTGFGAYQTAIPKFHDASGAEVPSSALNEYLNLLSGGGAIGGALALWFLLILILRIRKALNVFVLNGRRVLEGSSVFSVSQRIAWLIRDCSYQSMR